MDLDFLSSFLISQLQAKQLLNHESPSPSSLQPVGINRGLSVHEELEDADI
jgi:hypothetical protein